MKKHFILVIILLCFLNCSNWQDVTELKNGAIKNFPTDNLSETKDSESSNPTLGLKDESGDCLGVGIFQVNTYKDRKIESISEYRDGLLLKYVLLNSKTKEPTAEIEYFYKSNGELDHQKVIRGDFVDISEETVMENRQAQKEIQFQCVYLRSKGIGFPLADIVADEMSDLATVFSIAENCHDFKIETQTKENRKVIKFSGFNKTMRFHNSPIALLISNGDFINIKDYELTLENGFPLKEIYSTPEGKLTKMYFYENGKLTGVVYRFIDLQKQTKSLTKRFEYKDLR